MADSQQFAYFLHLPFELREMIWLEAAAQRTMLSHTTVAQPRTKTWHSAPGSTTELARGTRLIYHEQSRRPPPLGRTCAEARAAVMQHARRRPAEQWDVYVDAVLLTHLRPAALLGRRRGSGSSSRDLHLETVAGAGDGGCLAIPAALFTTGGVMPSWLFELMAVRNRVTHSPAKLVAFDFSLAVGTARAVECGLVQEGLEDAAQLVDIRNTTLLAKIEQLMGPSLVSTWGWTPQWMYDLRNVMDPSRRRLVLQSTVVPVEDMWLDCQAAALAPPGDKGRDSGRDVLAFARGGGSRYDRSHPWVRETMARIPAFDVVVMFTLNPI